jgi:putative hydrolase of the HAD superfamily
MHLIGFDADDTLWHNETLYARVHERYRALLASHHDAATVDRSLLATEKRNLELYGYGIKSYTLSAIETAITLTDGKFSSAEIRQLITLGQEMLAHPVELIEGVAETLAALAPHHRLVVITKGDLRDQQRKVAKSGLQAHFEAVEVVAEKDEPTYAALLRRHGVKPEQFLMVGNSVKSDILPVLALGGAGVHVPYHLQWELDRADTHPEASGRFFPVEHIRAVPAAITQWLGTL